MTLPYVYVIQLYVNFTKKVRFTLTDLRNRLKIRVSNFLYIRVLIMRIIDFHAHAFPAKIAAKAVEQLSSHYSLNIPYPGTLKSLLASADEAGVEKIVLHAAATNPDQVQATNDWIAGRCSGRIIGFGSLHPDYQEFKQELDRMYALGLIGIKLHSEFQDFPIDDARMWPVYEAIGNRFLVMIHMGDRHSDYSSPRRLARVLDAFPKLKVIAAHLGGWSSWDDARHYVLGRDLYVDTSSCTWALPPEEVTALIREHGVKRVLFGTDYPVTSHLEELERFNSLPLTPQEKEKILWENAEKLLQSLTKN